MRPCFALCLIFAALSAIRPAHADDMPIIVTYELKKQRHEAHLVARDPKAFWIHQIVARLEDKVPELSKPLKVAVTVQISFVVGRDGRLASKSVSVSSGNEEADRTAIAMLERAQPFPPMPTAMSDADLSFTLPVRFR